MRSNDQPLAVTNILLLTASITSLNLLTDTTLEFVDARFRNGLILSGQPPKTDTTLIANSARAHSWLDWIKRGESFEMIAGSENISKKRVQQTPDCALLAPEIVRAVMAGQYPVGLTTTWIATHSLPLDWREQRALVATL